MELQFHPDPARKLSANLYDVHHCCVYSEKLLMMDRGTVRNMESFYSKNKFEKLVHLVGFIIRTHTHAKTFFMPVCMNVPCQFTPLLNLYPPLFALTLFWLVNFV